MRARIAAVCAAAARRPEEVRLVAVSKLQPIERVRAALEAGHRLFGENRVQEAQGRWPQLRAAYPDVVLHLIEETARHAGHLDVVRELLD